MLFAPHKIIVFFNSWVNISKQLFNPYYPYTILYKNALALNTKSAPRAKHLNISLPFHIPPSI